MRHGSVQRRENRRSRDGRWIYFQSNRGGGRELWKMPAEGGDAVQVGGNGGVGVEWDGCVYFTKSDVDGGPPGIWRIPVGGGGEVRVLESVTFIDWSVFRRGICYLNREAKPGAAIELYDFATGEISQVAVLQDPPSRLGLSVSPDGRWILYLKDESAADIMLVENFR